ncbi:MAG: Fur family transcriptional regulator, partial [Prosthecobacter sp.]
PPSVTSPRAPSKPTGLECRMAVLGADVRLTPHSRVVSVFLAASTDHHTAYVILDRVKSRSPGISLATVYNCLDHLTTHGLIKQVHLERGQSRYCANLHEHVHFHCETCGKVIDAHPATDFDPAKFWNLPTGTRVTRTDLAIHGTCDACAAKS